MSAKNITTEAKEIETIYLMTNWTDVLKSHQILPCSDTSQYNVLRLLCSCACYFTLYAYIVYRTMGS